MNTRLALVVACFCVVPPLPPTRTFSQDEAAAVASFKEIAKRVDAYFSPSLVVLESDDFSSSPSGKINHLMKFDTLETSLDVTKTSSLISPYLAYILLRLHVSTNAHFGDIKNENIQLEGFQKADDALAIKKFSSCIGDDSMLDEKEWCIGNVKLMFAFQESAWVFKGAEWPVGSGIKSGQARRIVESNVTGSPEWLKVLSGKN